MNYDDFNQFCNSLPSTSYVRQWGDAHVWKVGGKVFAIGGWEQSNGPAYVFKTTEADFYFLQEAEGFQPAPYMASRGLKWIQIHDTSVVGDDDIKDYLKDSHSIVASGLTRKLQKELGLN